MTDSTNQVASAGQDRAFQVPADVAALPLRDTVLFPNSFMPLAVARESSVTLIDEAIAGGKVIGVFTQKDPTSEDPGQDDLHPIGTLTHIHKMFKLPDGSLRLIVQGLARIRMERVTATQAVPAGADCRGGRGTARGRRARDRRAAAQHPHELPAGRAAFAGAVRGSERAGHEHHRAWAADRFHRLEPEHDRHRRSSRTCWPSSTCASGWTELNRILTKELEVLELGSKIQSQVQSEVGKNQREYFLREQMKAIQKELGEGDEQAKEIDELREQIDAAGMPDEVKKEALRELDRLTKMPAAAAEYTVARTYIDWLIAVPWAKRTEEDIDLARTKQVLDADHSGFERVKDRILEYLAVRKLKPDMKGPILCFVGPPGVGKTSLAQSIARAIGRKFVRVSLGGMRDEAEIRGHRRTYIGALPGQIIQGLRRAESRNPVFILDEIDKLGADFRGDPASALLEVLDPEQNNSFRDHYLDVPFDLSEVLFITTANVLDTIPAPLRDRMEVLELAGYTEEEKLLDRARPPREPADHQPRADARAGDVHRRGAGGHHPRLHARGRRPQSRARDRRDLPQDRAASRGRATRPSVIVTRDVVEDLLGAPRHLDEEMKDRTRDPGVAVGLAWTPVGGDVLFVEASRMAGGSQLTLTGQLGDVMKESARIGLSWFRAHAQRFGVDPQFYKDSEIHLHVPAGAIPKDGPSAGVTMVMALASALSGRPVRGDVAMTGEITLSGKVLPVGGIKEKVLAARRAGHSQRDPAEAEREERQRGSDARNCGAG